MTLENLFKKTGRGIATLGLGLASVLATGLAGYTARAEEEKTQKQQTKILYPGGGSLAPCLPSLGCDPAKSIIGVTILSTTQCSPVPNGYHCLPPLICGDSPQSPDTDQGTGVVRIAPPKTRYPYLKDMIRI